MEGWGGEHKPHIAQAADFAVGAAVQVVVVTCRYLSLLMVVEAADLAVGAAVEVKYYRYHKASTVTTALAIARTPDIAVKR